MTSEVAIMNQRALVFAADSATTVSYYVSGKRKTRYFKGANKLFQLSSVHPVGLMIYGAGSLHDVPWELVVRDFRKTLGRDPCDKLATYAARFFEFVRTHTALFPDPVRTKVLVDAAIQAAVGVLLKALDNTAKLTEEARRTTVATITEAALNEWRQAATEKPLTDADAGSAVLAHRDAVATELTKLAKELVSQPELATRLAEIGVLRAMKNYTRMLDVTGVVIGGYGESEYFPSYERYECHGFLGNHFLAERKDVREITRERGSHIDSFAMGGMIDTFQMGIGPETFECVVDATEKSLRDFAGKVRDAVAPNVEIPNLDALVRAAANAHQDDCFGQSTQTHFVPLARVIGALPVPEMSTLARTLIELESLKERVTQESESVAGPIDVAAISKYDGFVWMERKHYFRPELNPRFFTRLKSQNGG